MAYAFWYHQLNSLFIFMMLFLYNVQLRNKYDDDDDRQRWLSWQLALQNLSISILNRLDYLDYINFLPPSVVSKRGSSHCSLSKRQIFHSNPPHGPIVIVFSYQTLRSYTSCRSPHNSDIKIQLEEITQLPLYSKNSRLSFVSTTSQGARSNTISKIKLAG